MLPILYSFRRCPYAIRARMALLQSGTAVELREVALRDKPSQMLDVSPKGTVPVLLCSDGSVIDESLAIMCWALHQSDPAGWLLEPDSPASQGLVEQCDGDFKQALDRYKYADRHPGHSQIEYRAAAETALIADIESELRMRPFLGGQVARLVDVAVFPFVRQFAAVDASWFDESQWTATRRWLRHWLGSAAFTGVMQKTEPWVPGQPSPTSAAEQASSCRN